MHVQSVDVHIQIYTRLIRKGPHAQTTVLRLGDVLYVIDDFVLVS